MMMMASSAIVSRLVFTDINSRKKLQSCPFAASAPSNLFYNGTHSAASRPLPPLVSMSQESTTLKPVSTPDTNKKKVEDDPWEALFQQLEEDLENDTDDTSEEEITEEDVANFEKELDTLFQDIENTSTDNSKANELGDVLKSQAGADNVKVDDHHGLVDDREGIDYHEEGNFQTGGDSDDDEEANHEQTCNDDEDLSDDDLEERRTVTLQKWQLRKLAAAVELGRRKVNIKSLAGDLKLDRDDVIYFLKSPPPELLMALSGLDGNRNEDDESDEDDESVSDEDEEEADGENFHDSLNANVLSTDNEPDMVEAKEYKKQTYGPRDWYKGKRIKKANIMTLQRVYKRSKWPTNSMIESLVQATRLPRARVLEWFEEERAKTGVQNPPGQSAALRKTWKRPVTHSFERLQ